LPTGGGGGVVVDGDEEEGLGGAFGLKLFLEDRLGEKEREGRNGGKEKVSKSETQSNAQTLK